jgi:hypothetical protein
VDRLEVLARDVDVVEQLLEAVELIVRGLR